MAGKAKRHGVEHTFVYRGILYGHIAGPLVWARLAAAIMRATASIQPQSAAGTETYVDDPLTAVGGTRVERRHRLLAYCSLWQALGLHISWHKAQLGDSAVWIGAKFEVKYVDGEADMLELTIGPEKLTKLEQEAKQLLEQTPCDRARLRRFAGLCSWVASVVPAARVFSTMVWAAAASKPAAGETEDHISPARVRFPLRWLIELCTRRAAHMPRLFPIQPPSGTIAVGFDASTTGGGAWLAFNGGPPSRYIVLKWRRSDEKVLKATTGDCGSQALWESYSLLIALKTWTHLLTANRAELHLFGDAEGVLRAVLAKRARNAAINLVIAEIGLTLAPTNFDLQAAHLWSEENALADALSRRAEGVEIPAELANAVKDKVRWSQYKFLRED